MLLLKGPKGTSVWGNPESKSKMARNPCVSLAS